MTTAMFSEAFEGTPVGGEGVIRPDESSTEYLARWQEQVRIAESFARRGAIAITRAHTESTTGHGFVDVLLFRKLKDC